MKLAHLILAHSNFQQVERLAKRLHSENSDVYIHLDKKANIADYRHITQLPGVFFIDKRVTVGWGNYSMVQATINGFEEILQKNLDYTHFNLLSGQDYPLKNITQIQDFLFANNDKSYICWLDIAADWPDGRERLLDYNFGDFNFPANHRLQPIVNKLLPKRKIPGNLKPYGRSQWLTITPECAAYAINYINSHNRLKRFFRMTWAVDEVFFQTILLNSTLKQSLVNDNLRYIEGAATGRPRILTIADAGVLLNSGKLFARKFDMLTDTAIFDYLDKAAGIIA